MAVSTIVGTIDTSITLNNVAYASPLTLLSTGAVVAPTGSGIDVTVNNARIFNAGYIDAAAGIGISFASTGYVFNQGVNAYIAGQTVGIAMSPTATSAGTIHNQGTIAGLGSGSAGIYLNTGSINNDGSAAVISGVSFGIRGDTLAVTNQGHIYGDNGVGIELNSGSVTNSGTLSNIEGGFAGVGVVGTGFVSNQGTVTGIYTGVALELGGTIENLGHSAFIYGVEAGVIIANNGATVSGGIAGIPPALVYNQGTIRSPGTAAVILEGGQITNASTGLLLGNLYGIQGATYAVTLENAGSIRAQSGFGVGLAASGNITNLAGGQIYGALRGIYIKDGAVITAHGTYSALSSVSNQGTIGGTTAAVVIEGAGYISNLGTGALMTGSIGAAIIAEGSPLGQTGTILNTGTIHGLIAGAAVSGTTGVVLNMGAQSSIYGGHIGVLMRGYSTSSSVFPSMTLYNQGNIYAASTAGVEMYGGVVINSGTAARIAGGTIGLFSQSFNSSVENEGLITGQLLGAGFGGGVVLDNAAGATISAAGAGIFAESVGYITNSGTIRGGHSPISLTGDAGVFIEGGGTFSNLAGSSFVYGDTFGVGLGFQYAALDGTTVSIAPVVYNQGSIFSGKLGVGVALGGGTLINEGISAIIKGGSFGVEISTIAATTALAPLVENQGSISGSADGITLQPGGFVTNASGALITGGTYGVDFGTVSANATLYNAGTISGAAAKGAYFRDGGTLLNTGIIRGSTGVGMAGVPGGSSITNEGTITGTNTGIMLTAGAVVSNLGAHASIGGTTYGIKSAYGANITDAGTIAGGVRAIYGYGNYTDVTLLPGAVIEGAVDASTIFDNELDFASTASAGTFDMGGSFSGFDVVNFDDGARWVLGGTSGELAADQLITGFTLGDALILDNFTATSFTSSGQVLTLSDGSSSIDIDFNASVLGHSFAIRDVSQGTEIIICHMQGTKIAIPGGEAAIEDLRIGDVVRTRFGGRQRIKWIGVQRYNSAFLKRDMLPVCISAGALRDGVPTRDLFVSPGHSLLLGGTLVLARELINGVTITQRWAPDAVAYYNIELERHDCVLAEGVWSETYADCPGLRAKFHNAAEFFALYHGQYVPDEPQLCAPRPLAGPLLAEALAPVLARAAAETVPGNLRGYLEDIAADGVLRGWAQDDANQELPLWLEFLVGEEIIGKVLANLPRADVLEAGFGGTRCGFVWSPPPKVNAACVTIRRAGTNACLGSLDAQAA